MSAMTDYQKAFRSNPDAFLQGAMSFCKEAAPRYPDEDEKSLWDRVWPWLLGIGGGYLALRGGELWGRYANHVGSQRGPVLGPLQDLLVRASHPGESFHWVRDEHGRSVPEFHSPGVGDGDRQ